MSKIKRTVMAVALAVTSIAGYAQQSNQSDDMFGQDLPTMSQQEDPTSSQARKLKITNGGNADQELYPRGGDRALEREGRAEPGQYGRDSLERYRREGEEPGMRRQNESELSGRERQAWARSKKSEMSDFQKFVLESSGTALPLYGAEFFGNAPSTFAPVSNTPVPADYLLGPGDQLLIRGWGTIDIDFRATLDRNGTINIPTIGTVVLGGVKAGEAEALIRAAVARLYKGVTVSVNFGQLRAMTIYVVGQARRPGTYTVSSLSTLVTGLFASGGPNANGSMRNVQVKRAGKVVAELDLYAFLAKGDKSGDVKLQDGDTIVIPPAGGFVALMGKVNVPAVYELKNGADTVESLLGLAGGLPVVADPRRAFLERIDPSRNQPRSVEQFALNAEGMKRTLKDGDVLNITSITPDFSNAVVLRGNVDQAVRVPFKPGMRISDLIPNREYLISRSSLKRKNNALLADEGETQLDTKTAKRISDLGEQENATSGKERTIAARIGSVIDEINWDYAVIERINRADLSVRLVPFNLGNVFDNPAGSDNVQLQPGDTVTVFSQEDVAVPMDKRRVFVRVDGEVQVPGVYQMSAGDTLQTLLAKAGGPTENAYLFGTAFYREQVRKEQQVNLEKAALRLETQLRAQQRSAIANNSGLSSAEAAAAATQRQLELQLAEETVRRFRQLKSTGRIAFNLDPEDKSFARLPQIKLANGDRLVVPARPDFVHIFGAVNAEASPVWRTNSRVKDYLQVAGLTADADVENIFIIRVDGTVVTSSSSNWFSGSIAGLQVMPGDSIVVPEKFDKETGWTKFTRTTREWAQIFASFGLGAAAIKSLQ